MAPAGFRSSRLASRRTAGRRWLGGFGGCVGRGFGHRLVFDWGSEGDIIHHGRRWGGIDESVVGENVAKGADALKFLDGAPIEPLGLRLETQEERQIGASFIDAAESLDDQEIAVLGGGDVLVVDQFGLEEAERAALGIEGFVEECGIHAGFHACEAE